MSAGFEYRSLRRCEGMGVLVEIQTKLRTIFSKFVLSGGGILNALRLYRYVSWFLTSLFYFLGPPVSSWLFKLGVVCSLFLGGIFAHRLYSTLAGKSPRFIRALAALETLGIALLLPSTGGIRSPFVWYAVNPIAMSAAEASLFWCCAILGEFLILAFTLGQVWGWAAEAPVATPFEHPYLVLILVLLTLGIRLLAGLVNRFHHQAQLLERQRAELERSWELLSTFYRLIEMISAHDNVSGVLDVFAQYSKRLLNAEKVTIWLPPSDLFSKGGVWATAGPAELYPEERAAKDLELVWLDLQRDPRLIERDIMVDYDRKIGVVYLPVHSPSRWYGILIAVFALASGEGSLDRRNLEFFSDFLAVALERCHLAEIYAQLLLAEEQNRIAAEIHDGVAQYLFNISCGCHLLKEKWANLSPEAARQHLDLLAKTAQQAAQELRHSIYRLSPHRQGKEVFVEGVNRYLEELSKMNGINVKLNVEGSEEVLSPALRKAFYRIIREACGNAIRHGACRSLRVKLYMSPKFSTVEIEDDGCGWQPSKNGESGATQGLGIWSMQRLAASFDGEMEIKSTPGKGTIVRCTVPKAGNVRNVLREVEE